MVCHLQDTIPKAHIKHHQSPHICPRRNVQKQSLPHHDLLSWVRDLACVLLMLLSPLHAKTETNDPCATSPYDHLIMVGDSLAQGILSGIGPDHRRCMKIIDLTQVSDGLLNTSPEEWVKRILGVLPRDHTKRAAVYMLIGTNDIIAMRKNRKILRPGSDEWDDAYREKLTRLMDGLGKLPAEVHWIELPITDRDRKTTMMHNRVRAMQEEAARGHIRYRHLNNHIADLDGFRFYLAREDGTKMRLRYKDRIHFTRHGYEFLATTLLQGN